MLAAPAHGVKVILTTRVAPREPAAAAARACSGGSTWTRGCRPRTPRRCCAARDPDGRLGLKDAPDALLAQARERTRGFPRALEAVAAILSADRNTTLPELLAETERLPENVVEALVGEAFNRLDPLAQQVMQALGDLPRAGAGGRGGLPAAALPAGDQQRPGAGPAGQHAVRPPRRRPLLPAPGRPRLRPAAHPGRRSPTTATPSRRRSPGTRCATAPPTTSRRPARPARRGEPSTTSPPSSPSSSCAARPATTTPPPQVLLDIDFDYLPALGPLPPRTSSCTTASTATSPTPGPTPPA